MKVSVVGLGKLGFTMATVFAERGCKVLGFDNNLKLIKNLNEGKVNFKEKNLIKLFSKNKKKILLNNKIDASITEAEIIFIIVPTPSKKNFSYESKYVKDVLKNIAPFIKGKKVVLTSTVSIGSCRNDLIPYLEKKSNLQEGKGFKFYYSPEFIALGNIIEDYLKPEIVLVGKNSKNDFFIEKFYKKICINKPYFSSCTIESAEISKISINSFQTYKITLINLLSLLSEKTEGAQINQVRNSIVKFFENKAFNFPGLSYGGPCLPRDNRALTYEFNKHKINTKLFNSIDDSNKLVLKDLIKKIKAKENTVKKIIFIGLSFKENTNDISESPTLKIIENIKKKNVEVYDQFINDISVKNLKYSPKKIENLNYIYNLKSSLIIIMHKNHALNFKKIHKSNLIINPWKLT